jgi:hypothetical protein
LTDGRGVNLFLGAGRVFSPWAGQAGRLTSLGFSRRREATSFQVECATPARPSGARALQGDDDRKGTEQYLHRLPRQALLLGHRGDNPEEGRQCPSLERYRSQPPTHSARPEPRFLADDRRRSHAWIIARPGHRLQCEDRPRQWPTEGPERPISLSANGPRLVFTWTPSTVKPVTPTAPPAFQGSCQHDPHTRLGRPRHGGRVT